MARMKAPAGMTSFSHAGVVHQVSEDGFVEVADQAIPEMKAHGLTIARPAPESEKESINEGTTSTSEELKTASAEEKASNKPQLKK